MYVSREKTQYPPSIQTGNRPGETMASTAIEKLFEHGKRAQVALANARKREKQATGDLILRAGTAASVIGGGIVAGAIDGKWGHDGKPETEKNGIAAVGPVPINVGIGIVLVASGIGGFLPGSEYLAAFGSSLIAYPIGKTIENRIVEKAAEK